MSVSKSEVRHLDLICDKVGLLEEMGYTITIRFHKPYPTYLYEIEVHASLPHTDTVYEATYVLRHLYQVRGLLDRILYCDDLNVLPQGRRK